MQQSLTVDRLAQMRGEPVYDANGDKIGKVDEIFYDLDSRQPEWIGIGTGFFGTRRVLVPVYGALATEDGITVPYDKSVVKEPPDIDGDEISNDTEQDLYHYYGIEDFGGYSTSDRTDIGDAGRAHRSATSGRANFDERSLTRSEEELAVGKRQVESGRVRLRKWVETE